MSPAQRGRHVADDEGAADWDVVVAAHGFDSETIKWIFARRLVQRVAGLYEE
jgi:hypothetical protein